MEQINILQISKKIPFPQRDGESVANYALARGLSNLVGVSIDLMSLHTNKHKTDEIEAIKNLSCYDKIEFISHDLNVDPFELVQHSISGDSYNINRFHSTQLAKRLEQLLRVNQYEVILLETIYTTSYIDIIRKVSPKTRIVLRLHNIEYQIWKQRAEQSKNPAKKILFKSLSRQLKQYTLDTIPKIDQLLTISTSDHNWITNSELLSLEHVHYQPVGIDQLIKSSNYTRVEIGKLHIGFIGAMDWDPNVDGLEWFMSKVWQPFFESQSNIHLHLAGRKYPKGRYANVGGVTEHGEVSDVNQFLDRLDILIAPLFIGSGVRIKILEAMAAGKVVISTPIGIAGIEVINGKEAIIAEKAYEFSDTINELHLNEEKLTALKRNANSFLTQHYNQEKLSNQLYNLLIQLKKRKTP